MIMDFFLPYKKFIVDAFANLALKIHKGFIFLDDLLEDLQRILLKDTNSLKYMIT